MNVNDLVKELGLEVFNKNANLKCEITGGFVGDLLSHVMGNSKEGQAWITVQTHKNVLAIASLNDLSAIIISDGLKPDFAMLESAEEEGIPVLGSTKSAFELAGAVYNFTRT